MDVRRQTLHTLGGPTVFLILILSPLPWAPYPVRGSIGLLVWMSWWWIAQPVHLAVTAFLPLVVTAVFGFLPVGTIASAYAEQLVFLLLGANMLVILWHRWGLDRRIALISLLGIGTGTRQQILTWFLVATVLSSVLPNAVVAASMMPIVIAMLRFIGIEDLGKSAFASALLIAVAWGTAVGGSGTPLGGAPNLLTIQFLEQRLIDHEFLFTTWLTRVLPLTIFIAGASLIYMRFAFEPEMERVEGSRAYFAQELRSLGPPVGARAMGIGPLRHGHAARLHAAALRVDATGAYTAFVFLAFGVVSFAIRHKNEPLLEWGYAQGQMVWGLIYLFAGGSALGQILSETGTAQFLADRLVPLAGSGGFLSVVIFSLLTIFITQITSNTATIAIVVPITISTFERLGQNPIPFVYLVACAGNYGLMLPSSSAGPAIAAGYGVNLRTMAASGLWLTLMIWILLAGAGYLLVRFWPGFGVA